MELESWKEYRRGLRVEDRIWFDNMANYARKHADAGSLAARPLLSEVLFFSITLEQEKLIAELEKKIQNLTERIIQLEQSEKKSEN